MTRRRPLVHLVPLVLVVLFSSSSALARLPAIERALPPDVASQAIADLRTEVRSLAAARGKPVVVFDIDGTLIDGKNREIPGAVELVKGILADGGRVVYLTGRKDKRHAGRKGPEHRKVAALLRGLGFPTGRETRLYLNDTGKPTLDYKAAMQPVIQRLGKPVALLENEIRNARLFRRQYPSDVMVFRLRTYSVYPDPGRGSRGIRVIKDYRNVRREAPIAASRRTPPSLIPRR